MRMLLDVPEAPLTVTVKKLVELSWKGIDWVVPMPAKEGDASRGNVAVALTRGEIKRVKEVTVVGLGITMVTLVLVNALRLEREIEAEANEVNVWGVNDGTEREG
jgi:hypothetical protein